MYRRCIWHILVSQRDGQYPAWCDESTHAVCPPRPKEISNNLQTSRVPWEGSQYAPAEHRSSQASGSYELDWNITSQLNALITLTSNNCLSTPRILDLKYGWQETADPVPGGYIIFILMSYLPGVQLTKAFWGLEDSVREQIRQAFKLTWL